MKMVAMMDKQPNGAQLILISLFAMLFVFLFELALLVDAIAFFNHLVPLFFGDAKSSTNPVAVHVKASAVPAAMIRLKVCID